MLWLRCRRRYYRRRTRSAPMRAYLDVGLPAAGGLAAQAKFLSIDLETTGLDASSSEIASVGWVPVDNGKILLAGAEHHHVAVENGVGQSAAIHQISDTQLLGAESITQIMRRLLQVASGRVLVFHNATLDMAFLNSVSRKVYGLPLLAPLVDTLLLEKNKLMRRQEGIAPGELRLFACRHRYGLPDYPAHNALVDALATAELLLAQLAYRGPDTRLGEIL